MVTGQMGRKEAGWNLKRLTFLLPSIDVKEEEKTKDSNSEKTDSKR